MVLIRILLLALGLAALCAGGFVAPVGAHKNHQQARAEGAQAEAGAEAAGVSAGERGTAQSAAATPAAPAPGLGERMVRWLGRMHPFAVHFPIALYPIALVALVLARRRSETVELIRSIIIIAGVAAASAALLGWLNAAFGAFEPDPVLAWHRWLGTGLGLVGGAAAMWAWRRRASVYGGAMVGLLTAITAVLLVQAWLGAALTHGMEHLAF